MDYIVRLYHGDSIIEKEIKKNVPFTIGNGRKDSITVENLDKGCFSLKLSDGMWAVETKNKKYASIIPNGQANDMGSVVVYDMADREGIKVYEMSSDYGHTVNVASADSFTVGRNDKCDIAIKDRKISEPHLRLTRNGDRWNFEDLKSTNGTYFNGKLSKKGTLNSNDELTVGFTKIVCEKDWIHITTKAPVTSRLSKETSLPAIESVDEKYPLEIKRSPRLKEEVTYREFNIEAPPSIGGKPEINWLNVLLMPLLTVGIMGAVSFFMAGPVSMLYMSAPMALTGVIMSILNYRSQKKKYGQNEDLRFQKYGEYLQDQQKAIENCINEQRRVLTSQFPSCQRCIAMTEDREMTLWDRRIFDNDFMTLRIGTGSIPSCAVIKAPHEGLSLVSDELRELPQQIENNFREAHNCPITVDFKKEMTCGIVGSRSNTFAMGKNLIIQASAHHGCEDLKIAVICDPQDRDSWSFVRWLPHNFDGTRNQRYFADTYEKQTELLNKLGDILSNRNAELSDRNIRAVPKLPYYLIVFASREVLSCQALQLLNVPGINAAAIFLNEDISAIPLRINSIIDMGELPFKFFETENTAFKQSFKPDEVKEADYERFSRSMAPLRMDTAKKDARLPKSISFLQGYSCQRPAMLDIKSRWASGRPEESMAVPVGVSASGEPFFFDINEKVGGPHGVVGGTTGSGKSEMVQSWILSMAVNFPPDEVSFVLIDFKGTGLILPLKNLPHIAGTISDLDDSIGRNLIALENELIRRKALFDRHGVSNITEYLTLLHRGGAKEKLPYLFIVIDEFAEFKKRFPEFMQAIDGIFATGRTLGVYMILLTQHPSSAVDEKITANTRFRWCLKVANSADSRDMLHNTDAAKITNPGRAYIQIGEDEVYELIQSYWSGAPYNPYRALKLERFTKVSVVDIYGKRVCCEPEKTTGYRSEKNEIDAVVEYLDSYCRENNIARARSIWTEKLPSEVYLKNIMQIAFDGKHWSSSYDDLKATIGLIDDPGTQSQYPLYFNFTKNGHTAVYGAPGTGKTTLLHTAIVSMALAYAPDKLNMYLMDFGGGSLNIFKDLPHVGAVALGGDDEKIKKMSELISGEIKRRKQLLMSEGLMNYRSYEEVTGKSLPAIVLVLDNSAPVAEMYPDLSEFLEILTREGSAYGIFLLVSVGGANSISYRISQNIKNCACLNMTDPGDYAGIVGRLEGLTISHNLGRGIIKGKPPLEFQTALPMEGKSEAERVLNIRNLSRLMNEKWDGSKAQNIPILPENVYLKDYDGKNIFLGIDKEEYKPVDIDLRKKQFLIVSHDGSCEEEISALTCQIKENFKNDKVITFNKNTDPASFDEAMEDMIPELQRRKDAFDEDEFDSKNEGYIVVIVEDYERCFDSCTNDTVKRLSNLAVLGRGLNVILVSFCRSETLKKLYFAGDICSISIVKNGAALLLGGSISSHEIFVSDAVGSLKLAFGKSNDAVFIDDGKTIFIRAAER